MNFIVRDIDKSIVHELDKIVKYQNYDSRNQLVIDILKRYVAVKDKVYLEAMTAVSRTLIREEIKQLDNVSTRSLQIIEAAALRFLQASQKIDTYLSDDFLIKSEDNNNDFSSDRNDYT